MRKMIKAEGLSRAKAPTTDRFSPQIPLKSWDLNSLDIEVLYKAIFQISTTTDFNREIVEFRRKKKYPKKIRPRLVEGGGGSG